MNKKQLSNLAFLINSLVSSPSRNTFKLAQDHMDFNELDEFYILGSIAFKLHPSLSRKQRSDILKQETGKLMASANKIERYLGDSLYWSITSSKNIFRSK